MSTLAKSAAAWLTALAVLAAVSLNDRSKATAQPAPPPPEKPALEKTKTKTKPERPQPWRGRFVEVRRPQPQPQPQPGPAFEFRMESPRPRNPEIELLELELDAMKEAYKKAFGHVIELRMRPDVRGQERERALMSGNEIIEQLRRQIMEKAAQLADVQRGTGGEANRPKRPDGPRNFNPPRDRDRDQDRERERERDRDGNRGQGPGPDAKGEGERERERDAAMERERQAREAEARAREQADRVRQYEERIRQLESRLEDAMRTMERQRRDQEEPSLRKESLRKEEPTRKEKPEEVPAKKVDERKAAAPSFRQSRDELDSAEVRPVAFFGANAVQPPQSDPPASETAPDSRPAADQRPQREAAAETVGSPRSAAEFLIRSGVPARAEANSRPAPQDRPARQAQERRVADDPTAELDLLRIELDAKRKSFEVSIQFLERMNVGPGAEGSNPEMAQSVESFKKNRDRLRREYLELSDRIRALSARQRPVSSPSPLPPPSVNARADSAPLMRELVENRALLAQALQEAESSRQQLREVQGNFHQLRTIRDNELQGLRNALEQAQAEKGRGERSQGVEGQERLFRELAERLTASETRAEQRFGQLMKSLEELKASRDRQSPRTP